ncbi:MAG: site-specific integrase [Clostridia bacterium]
MDQKTPELILRFLSYKLNIQNRSKLTVSEYDEDLNLFFRYILACRTKNIENIDTISIESIDVELIKSVQTSEIYAFLYYLANVRNNKPNSRARRLAAVKSFYKFCVSKIKILEINAKEKFDFAKVSFT